MIPYKDRWQVKRDGVADFEFPTKQEALDKVRADARLMHPIQVIIHNADGKIADENTYDVDPIPPHG